MTKRFLSRVLVLTLICALAISSVAANAFSAWSTEKEETITPVNVSFEEYTLGDFLSKGTNEGPAPFRDNWSPFDILGNHGQVIQGDASNKYVLLTGFFEAIYDHTVACPFQYSVDIRNVPDAPFALFARTVTTKIALGRGEWVGCADFYEDDNAGFIGGTGYAVKISAADKITVVIKAAGDLTSTSKPIENKTYEFTVDADFAARFVNIKIMDNGSRANIYVADKLACTLEFSNKGTYEVITSGNAVKEEEFMKKVVIKDADGNVIDTVENSLVGSYGELAFGVRVASNVHMDNLVVAPYVAANDPGKVTDPSPSSAKLKNKCIDAITGVSATSDKATFVQGAVEEIKAAGWFGADTAIDMFGYIIDGGEPVYNAGWAQDVGADDPVRAEVNGGDLAKRYGIFANVKNLKPGEHTLKYIVKTVDGTVFDITSLTLTVEADPAKMGDAGALTVAIISLMTLCGAAIVLKRKVRV